MASNDTELLKEINIDMNLDSLVTKLATIESTITSSEEISENNSSSNSVQLHILRTLQQLNLNMKGLREEMASVKEEVSYYKTLSNDYKSKIEKLESENKNLLNKVDFLETNDRMNTLLLSGPLVKISANSTPSDLVDQSIKNIKQVYNFDLRKNDIIKCTKIKAQNQRRGQILLTLGSNLRKNELISTVAVKDKRNGVPLNINEFLSTRNANLLYQLRMLRKDNKEKIYSCFSRHGRVYYKPNQNSTPKLIASERDIAQLIDNIQNTPPVADPSQERPLNRNHPGPNSQSTPSGPSRRSERIRNGN